MEWYAAVLCMEEEECISAYVRTTRAKLVLPLSSVALLRPKGTRARGALLRDSSLVFSRWL